MLIEVTTCTIIIMVYTAGKKAMAENPAQFNKEASKAYKELSSLEKESLRKEALKEVQLTQKSVLKRVEKIFLQIQQMVILVEILYPKITLPECNWTSICLNKYLNTTWYVASFCFMFAV